MERCWREDTDTGRWRLLHGTMTDTQTDRQTDGEERQTKTNRKGKERESAPSSSLHKNGSLASYYLLLDDLNADLTKFLNGV